jgi:5-methylcytosine-specific restriction endonuclease McrA
VAKTNRSVEYAIKYTREALGKAVAESKSMADVCRYFGRRPHGSVYQHIRSRVRRLNLDTSHFLGKAAKAGKNNSTFRKADSILVNGYSDRAKSHQLRRAMLEIGVVYKCYTCGISDWLGSDLRLQVDHVDGNWSDCRRENVRFLCPNCHSQTSNFCKPSVAHPVERKIEALREGGSIPLDGAKIRDKLGSIPSLAAKFY